MEETPRDYLNSTGTIDLVRSAFLLVLRNRPEKPLEFLVDYFAEETGKPFTGTGKSIADKCCSLVTVAHYSSPVFQENLLKSFELMKADGARRQASTGLSTDVYNEYVLRLFSLGNHEKQSNKLLEEKFKEKMAYHKETSFSFTEFRERTYAALIYNEIRCLAVQLFDQVFDEAKSEGGLGLPELLSKNIIELFKRSLARSSDLDVIKQNLTYLCQHADYQLDQTCVSKEEFTRQILDVFLSVCCEF